jgi:hypothetical protein
MRGGRAFAKPFPITLGTNGEIIDYGAETAQLASAQTIGMKIWREELPWNFVKPSGITGFEVTAGTYLSATATTAAAAVATIKSYGMKPLIVVTVNSAPGLSSSWTSGPPCTPAQFASAMGWIVAQSGMQGLDWELLNEPDGSSWNVSASLLAQAHHLAYAAMKSADSTCTVHGLVLESIAPAGYGNGTDYFNSYVTAAKAISSAFPAGFYDIASFHMYFVNASGSAMDLAPDAYGGQNGPWPAWLNIANFQANRIAKGDTTPMWITEFGWQSTGDGSMTPKQQAQFYQNLLLSLYGLDPVNKVLFSSYLKAMCQFAMGGEGANWGIYGEPAATVLAELVSG